MFIEMAGFGFENGKPALDHLNSKMTNIADFYNELAHELKIEDTESFYSNVNQNMKTIHNNVARVTINNLEKDWETKYDKYERLQPLPRNESIINNTKDNLLKNFYIQFENICVMIQLLKPNFEQYPQRFRIIMNDAVFVTRSSKSSVTKLCDKKNKLCHEPCSSTYGMLGDKPSYESINDSRTMKVILDDQLTCIDIVKFVEVHPTLALGQGIVLSKIANEIKQKYIEGRLLNIYNAIENMNHFLKDIRNPFQHSDLILAYYPLESKDFDVELYMKPSSRPGAPQFGPHLATLRGFYAELDFSFSTNTMEGLAYQILNAIHSKIDTDLAHGMPYNTIPIHLLRSYEQNRDSKWINKYIEFKPSVFKKNLLCDRNKPSGDSVCDNLVCHGIPSERIVKYSNNGKMVCADIVDLVTYRNVHLTQNVFQGILKRYKEYHLQRVNDYITHHKIPPDQVGFKKTVWNTEQYIPSLPRGEIITSTAFGLFLGFYAVYVDSVLDEFIENYSHDELQKIFERYGATSYRVSSMRSSDNDGRLTKMRTEFLTDADLNNPKNIQRMLTESQSRLKIYNESIIYMTAVSTIYLKVHEQYFAFKPKGRVVHMKWKESDNISAITEFLREKNIYEEPSQDATNSVPKNIT